MQQTTNLGSQILTFLGDFSLAYGKSKDTAEFSQCESHTLSILNRNSTKILG
jgi:hypothetical protein